MASSAGESRTELLTEAREEVALAHFYHELYVEHNPSLASAFAAVGSLVERLANALEER